MKLLQKNFLFQSKEERPVLHAAASAFGSYCNRIRLSSDPLTRVNYRCLGRIHFRVNIVYESKRHVIVDQQKY
jgi:hypothetical protein